MARAIHINTQTQAESPCLRPKDAATFLQIGLSTLWKWAKEGRVPAPVKMGGRCTVWRRADLEAYLGLGVQNA